MDRIIYKDTFYEKRKILFEKNIFKIFRDEPLCVLLVVKAERNITPSKIIFYRRYKMKKWLALVVLISVVTQTHMSANPLARVAVKKVLRDKQVLLKLKNGGKVFLHNLQNGKKRRVRLHFDKFIEMPKATSGARTKFGYSRNSKKFWQKFSKKYPHMFSKRNRLRIRGGKSPVVDRTWMRHFKEHSPFNGQILEHHHMNGKGFAVPLPKGLHRGRGNSGFFHSKMR
jgi:hypothetical protein